MNINEKIVPILANKDGKPGIAFKNTETGEVSGWTAKGDITPDQQTKLDAYATQQGKRGYRLDPERFKRDLQRQQNLEAGSRKQGESTADFHRRLRQQLEKDFPTTRNTTGEQPQPKPQAPKPSGPSLRDTAAELRAMRMRSIERQGGRADEVSKLRSTLSPAQASASDKRKAELEKVRQQSKAATMKKEAYDVVLDYLLSEGHADTVDEAHYVMMQMDAEYIQSIVEGFPTTGPLKVDPAEKLKLIQDPKSGERYYIGPGGGRLTPGQVKGVMSGELMVKGGKNKPTTQVAHYELEGEVIGEGDPSFKVGHSSADTRAALRQDKIKKLSQQGSTPGERDAATGKLKGPTLPPV